MINMDKAARWSLSSADAFKRSGAAANSAMSKLSKLVEKIPEYAEGRDRAVFCREKVVPAMETLREPVDELEMIVDKEMWPMPSYGDLVFEV